MMRALLLVGSAVTLGNAAPQTGSEIIELADVPTSIPVGKQEELIEKDEESANEGTPSMVEDDEAGLEPPTSEKSMGETGKTGAKKWAWAKADKADWIQFRKDLSKKVGGINFSKFKWGTNAKPVYDFGEHSAKKAAKGKKGGKAAEVSEGPQMIETSGPPPSEVTAEEGRDGQQSGAKWPWGSNRLNSDFAHGLAKKTHGMAILDKSKGFSAYDFNKYGGKSGKSPGMSIAGPGAGKAKKK